VGRADKFKITVPVYTKGGIPNLLKLDAGKRYIIKYTLLFIIVNIPFLIIFYDYFNLNGTLLSTSYLFLGLNPYHYGNMIVAGLFVLPYNLLQFIFYYYSNFNVYFTYIALKVVGLLLIYLTGLLVLKMIPPDKKNLAKTAFAAIIFNPLILFDNDVDVSNLIISMFFTILAFYLIFYCRDKENLTIPLGALSIIIAGSSFYFPLLLVPTFLVYLNSNMNRLKFILFVILFGGITLMIQKVFSLSTSFLSTLSSTALWPYSIFNLLPIHLQELIGKNSIIITATLIILSLIVPFILHRGKLTVAFASFILLAILLFLEPSGVFPNAFLTAVPFAIVAMISANRNVNLLRTLLPQLFIIPGYLIIQLLNGPGYTSGIFYNLYTVMPNYVYLFYRIPSPVLVWKILLLSGLILFIFGVFYLLKFEKFNKEFLAEKVQKSKVDIAKRPNFHLRIYQIVVILLIFIILPITLPHYIPNTNNIQSSSQFPTMMFFSPFPGTLELLPSPSMYEIYGNEVLFYPESPGQFFYGPHYLYRNLSDQQMEALFRINIQWVTNGGTNWYPLLSTNLYTLNFAEGLNASVTEGMSENESSVLVQNKVIQLPSGMNEKVLHQERIHSASPTADYIILNSTKGNHVNYFPFSQGMEVAIISTATNSKVIIDGKIINFYNSSKWVSFGELLPSPFEIKFTFNQLLITGSGTPPNYLLIVTFSTILGPVAMVSGYLFYYKVRTNRFRF